MTDIAGEKYRRLMAEIEELEEQVVDLTAEQAVVAESPNPGMSGTSTRNSAASGRMFRIQCVHEPLAPWTSSSGRPSPQARHSMEPAPRGTSVRVARDSILDTKTAGSSGASDVMHEECSSGWLTGGADQSARSPRKMRLTSADWSSSADGPLRMVRPDSRM